MSDGVKLRESRVHGARAAHPVEGEAKPSSADLKGLGQAALSELTGGNAAIDASARRVFDPETAQKLLDTLSEASSGDLMDVLRRAAEGQDH